MPETNYISTVYTADGSAYDIKAKALSTPIDSDSPKVYSDTGLVFGTDYTSESIIRPPGSKLPLSSANKPLSPPRFYRVTVGFFCHLVENICALVEFMSVLAYFSQLRKALTLAKKTSNLS